MTTSFQMAQNEYFKLQTAHDGQYGLGTMRIRIASIILSCENAVFKLDEYYQYAERDKFFDDCAQIAIMQAEILDWSKRYKQAYLVLFEEENWNDVI